MKKPMTAQVLSCSFCLCARLYGGRFQQTRFQGLQLNLALYFRAKQIGDIKCIDCPLAIGRNMRAVQRDLGFKQRQRQIIQQGWAIQRVDFNHRKPV